MNVKLLIQKMIRSTLFDDIKKDAISNGCKDDSFFSLINYMIFMPQATVLIPYRISNQVKHYGILGRFISQLCWRISVILSGCLISKNAKISPGVSLPHPTGLVIGENVVIKSNVTIYQNVTIGKKNVLSNEYPVIDEKVLIGAGSVIMGAINVGKSSIIGANSVVIENVVPGTTVAGSPARPLKKK